MQKLIYFGLFLATVGISIVGCEESQLAVESEPNVQIKYSLDNISSIRFSGDQESLVRNETDPDEEKLNQQLLDLAEATKDLTKDYAFNELIVRIARESNVETIYYSEIKEHGPAFYRLINQNLAVKGLSIESITENMTHKPILPNPEFPETGELEVYEPSIFVPNALIADASLQALISPNIETELDGEDYILAWYFDESGLQRETMLNESTATQTSNPVMILNHSIPKIQMDVIGDYIPTTKNAKSLKKASGTYFQSTRIKIKNGYRYESSGDSEFAFGGVIVISGSPPANFLHYTNNNDYSAVIKKVTENQISSSSSVYVNSHHADNFTPYSDYRVFWNTFERDWNRGIQSLGNGNTFGQTWMFWGRARYSNDWYQWNPTGLTQYTHFEWFGWETEIPFSSWKSEYNLVKVN